MDPKAALDAAEEALASGDKAEAREYLANYASWRRGGGFQPAGGDARHAALSKRLRSRKRVSKNSRKARLRRNADEGPNLLLLGGLALGGYLAYRWLSDKSSKAPASVVAAPAAKAPALPPTAAAPAVPTQAEAWAAGLAAAKGQPPMVTEQQFGTVWGTLTDDEKRLFVDFMLAVGSSSSETALPAVMSRPGFEPMMRKLQAAAPPPPPPPSASKGTSGIGNYYNDGE